MANQQNAQVLLLDHRFFFFHFVVQLCCNSFTND
jgi:hypothetical protein